IAPHHHYRTLPSSDMPIGDYGPYALADSLGHIRSGVNSGRRLRSNRCEKAARSHRNVSRHNDGHGHQSLPSVPWPSSSSPYALKGGAATSSDVGADKMILIRSMSSGMIP